MDGNTLEVQALFQQDAYRGCIELAQRLCPGGMVDDASLVRLVYAARASLALGDVPGARQLVGEDAEAPLAMSVLLLADLIEMDRNGDDAACADVLEQLTTLLDVVEPHEQGMVRYHLGWAYAVRLDMERALDALQVTGAGGGTDLECVAMGVHLLLSMHRPDLAEAEYLSARRLGDDAPLVQAMEAWIALVKGGRSTQQAFYVYEEATHNTALAHTPNMVPALVGKAVAQAALGDVPKAEATLADATALAPTDATVAANRAVVTALTPTAGHDDVDAAVEAAIAADPASPLAQRWAAQRQALADAVAAASASAAAA